MPGFLQRGNGRRVYRPHSAPPPPSSLLTGLVAYYNLDDVNDALGVNNLTNTGTVTFVAGLVGNAANFVPTQTLSHVANATLQVGDIDFTFDCAVRFSSLANFRVFASQWVAAPQCAWALYFDYDTSRFSFAVSNNGSAFTSIQGITFGAPSINTWYYVQAYHDAANNKIGISINNGAFDTKDYALGVIVSTDPFTIGNGIGLPHAGLVDEFGFWKRRLTADETTKRYNGGALSTYPFDGYSTGLEVDYVSTDGNGVKTYNVTSQFNANGTHVLRVLEPDNPAVGVVHSFIYVLPVEAELNTVFGDGLETLRALDAHNTYNATIIAPSFDIMPWYANHATNAAYQYENFMTLDLQPWVKANLSQSGSEQHWLLGFSKSGLGGMGLLLKHPDLFTLGAFWDFPAGMVTYTDNDANLNYGTQANYDNNYKLTASFLEMYKTPFLAKNRIWINGYSLFQTDVDNFDTLLTSKSILHTTATNVSRDHLWGSGWVASAVAGLYDNSLLY